MRFTTPPKAGKRPAEFAWVSPRTRTVEVVDPDLEQVGERAAALARLLDDAEVARSQASSRHGFAVHHEALSGLAGFHSSAVDLDEVLAGRVRVVVLPGQVGWVAALYHRALDSLRLHTASLDHDDDVLDFGFDATMEGLVAMATGTCPLVDDPRRVPTEAELDGRGPVLLDVWTDAEALGRPEVWLRFDLTHDEFARQWRTWYRAIVDRLKRGDSSQTGGEQHEAG